MKRTIITIIMIAMLALTFGQFIIPASSARQENHIPAAEITDPNHGANVFGVIEIGIRATDRDGVEDIENVHVRIDEGEWKYADFIEADQEHKFYQAAWDTSTVDNGWHHIHARTYDGKNYSEVNMIGVQVGNEPPHNQVPRVEIMEPAMDETVSGEVEILLAAMDPDGNDELERVQIRVGDGEWLNTEFMGLEGNHSWWSRTWNTAEFENGVYHLRARAWDGGDEHSDVDVVEVVVHNGEENHIPEAKIVEIQQGATVSGVVQVFIRASDANGRDDVEKVMVRIDELYWNEAEFHRNGDAEEVSIWIYDWNTTPFEDGEHHISAKAFDQEDDSEADVIGVIVDNIEENHRPVAEIVEIQQGATVSGVVEVWIRAADANGMDDIEHVFVWIDDNEWQNATFVRNGEGHSFWVYEWDTTAFENGEHHIWTIAYDGVDEGEENWVGVFVENIVENGIPKVEIIEPGRGAQLHGVVRVSVAASDPDGNDHLEMVFVRIDNGEWQNATFHDHENGNAVWIIEWNTSAVENGEHKIHAIAFDGEDESEVHAVGVLVHNEIHENHPPTARIIDVEPIIDGHLQGVVNVWIRVSDLDGLDEIVLVEARIDEGPWQPARQVAHDREFTLWSYVWDTTTVRDGRHLISARAADGESLSRVSTENYMVRQANDDEPHHDERFSRLDETWENIYEKPIESGIENGTVGAEMTISKDLGKPASNFVSYLPGMEMEMELVSDGRIDITVRGDFSTGKVVILNIDETMLDITNFEDIIVKFDGSEIDYSNVNVVLAEDGNEPIYCLTMGNDGLRVLIYIPHFSEHVITIESGSFISAPLTLAAEGSTVSFWIVAIIAGAVIVILLIVNVMRIGKREHRLIANDERIPGLSPMYNLMDRNFDDEEEPEDEWEF